MSILSVYAAPLSRDDRKAEAECWVEIFADACDEEFVVKGKSYFLFSEDTLLDLLEELVKHLNSPSED